MRRIIIKLAQCQVLKRICFGLALLLIALVFGLADSSLATRFLHPAPPLDKLLHAGFYGGIAALLWFSGIVKSRLATWLLVVGVGILDELLQRSIAGRESSFADLLADVTGITLGLWLAHWLLSRFIIRRP